MAASTERAQHRARADYCRADILAGIPETERYQLHPLARSGPALVERIIGRRHHRATIIRWAVTGIGGVRLRTVMAGRTRLTSLAWLCDFFQALERAARGVGRG